MSYTNTEFDELRCLLGWDKREQMMIPLIEKWIKLSRDLNLALERDEMKSSTIFLEGSKKDELRKDEYAKVDINNSFSQIDTMFMHNYSGTI